MGVGVAISEPKGFKGDLPISVYIVIRSMGSFWDFCYYKIGL